MSPVCPKWRSHLIRSMEDEVRQAPNHRQKLPCLFEPETRGPIRLSSEVIWQA